MVSQSIGTYINPATDVPSKGCVSEPMDCITTDAYMNKKKTKNEISDQPN
jgi:hypothetical protein